MRRSIKRSRDSDQSENESPEPERAQVCNPHAFEFERTLASPSASIIALPVMKCCARRCGRKDVVLNDYNSWRDTSGKHIMHYPCAVTEFTNVTRRGLVRPSSLTTVSLERSMLCPDVVLRRLVILSWRVWRGCFWIATIVTCRSLEPNPSIPCFVISNTITYDLHDQLDLVRTDRFDVVGEIGGMETA